MKKKLIFALVFSLLCPVMVQGSQQEITENIAQESSADAAQESPADTDQENPEDSPITLADADEIFEEGRKAQRGSIKVVDLSGTWFEMGRQYGALMKKELDEVLFVIDTVIENNEGNASKAEHIVETQTSQTPWRISQFFEGAAETSGFTVEQLQLANAIERIGGLPKCSVAMTWGDYAEDDLIIGRNYDYSDALALLKDDIAVTVYHPADGALATATIGYAGEIYAVNGLNEKGLFLELNNGRPSTNIKSPNTRVTGTTMLFEILFEADTLDDMDLFFNTTNCSSSYIINVADKNEARSYEWCPIDVKRGEKDLPEGLLVSTNYYVNPDWLFVTPSDEASWEGLTRRSNLIKLCEAEKGKMTEEKMMRIIETPIKDGGAENELTVYQLVVVPGTMTMWLRVIGGSDWTPIDMGSFLVQE